MSTLGQRIKAARERKGWSQQDLASAVGAFESDVRQWERDRAMPSVGNVIAICSEVGVTADHLLGLARQVGA